MFKNILFIFLFSQICKSLQYLNFNDNFTYMFSNESENISLDGFSVYLGNELILINIDKQNDSLKENYTNNNTIIFDKNHIMFSFTENGTDDLINMTYYYDNTIVYSCDDKIFTFSNGTTEVNVSFLTNESYKNKMYIKLEYNKTNNISIDFTGIPYKILSADAEFLFIENKFFSFVLILAGFLISLYGAYHYNISLVIHIFFLLNFFFCDIINFFGEVQLYIAFISFGFFIISLSFSIFLNTNKKESFKQILINIIYGATLGFTLFKTIFYYLFYFLNPIDFDTISEKWRFPVYFFILIIFIATFIFLSLFDVFGIYAYVPCSSIAGSFYAIKGIQYVLGGYYSNILFYKNSLRFQKLSHEDKKGILLDIILTYLILHIFIILLSFIFQIRYIKFKKIEMNIEASDRSSKLSGIAGNETKIKGQSNEQTVIKEEDEALLNSKMRDENSLNEEDEINDQDD